MIAITMLVALVLVAILLACYAAEGIEVDER